MRKEDESGKSDFEKKTEELINGHEFTAEKMLIDGLNSITLLFNNGLEIHTVQDPFEYEDEYDERWRVFFPWRALPDMICYKNEIQIECNNETQEEEDALYRRHMVKMKKRAERKNAKKDKEAEKAEKVPLFTIDANINTAANLAQRLKDVIGRPLAILYNSGLHLIIRLGIPGNSLQKDLRDYITIEIADPVRVIYKGKDIATTDDMDWFKDDSIYGESAFCNKIKPFLKNQEFFVQQFDINLTGGFRLLFTGGLEICAEKNQTGREITGWSLYHPWKVKEIVAYEYGMGLQIKKDDSSDEENDAYYDYCLIRWKNKAEINYYGYIGEQAKALIWMKTSG